ncbi:DUF7287 family protein [Natrialba taiwanensis]|uniref:Uncharacterized protein n=1 Tax=Natrialba taiwanensis DSM 12281 TaxID=1230458 RepID=L9ZJ14_9EURY|nr:hypothetical protein [Natrialba taiwanensis]ELY85148.1 hypothetical protein C484_21342 [Natrialba taiwanensis DSM 12281]
MYGKWTETSSVETETRTRTRIGIGTETGTETGIERRSLTRGQRGQTTQDFVVGIGIFILAMAFVFSFLPSLITPFDSSAGGAEIAQADRIADQVVTNLSDSDRPNEINASEFEARYTGHSAAELRTELGLRASENGGETVAFDRVNVSVETLTDGPPDEQFVDPTALAAGETYNNQSAASTARIVTVADEEGILDDGDCEPACRLVVRTW